MSELYTPNERTEIKKFSEKAPCGDIITTQYFEDGKLVRQDKEVVVDAKWLAMQGLTRL